MLRLAALPVLFLALLGACNSPPNPMCARDTDCKPGETCADGFCTPRLIQDSGPIDLQRVEARVDARPQLPDTLRPDGVVTCQPNKDDVIQRAEMPIKVGASIQYSVGSGIKVNLLGTKVAGRTNWDLTATATDEHPYLAELEPVASWAAADFAGATYMSLLDAGYKTYGVFKATQTALQLIGVISKTADKTKLSYSSPVDTLHFPIAVSDTFKTDAIVTGHMDFFPYAASIYETYDVTVLDAGALKLPELTLDVVLVRVVVKQNPTVNPFLITTRVSFLFIAECYGIVGQIFAESDPGSQLSSVLASERRRISK